VVAPTVDGNLLAGPNSVLIGEKGDDATTAPGLAEVLEGARKLVPNLPVREAITNFAGLRAVAEPGGDFVIGHRLACRTSSMQQAYSLRD